MLYTVKRYIFIQISFVLFLCLQIFAVLVQHFLFQIGKKINRIKSLYPDHIRPTLSLGLENDAFDKPTTKQSVCFGVIL